MGREQTLYRDPEGFGGEGQSGTHRETSVYQRFKPPSNRSVECHRQRKCELLLDSQVEECSDEEPVRRKRPLQVVWRERASGCTSRADGSECPRPDNRYLVLRRLSEGRTKVSRILEPYSFRGIYRGTVNEMIYWNPEGIRPTREDISPREAWRNPLSA